MLSWAVLSRILIKEDIPGRAGVDRPSEQQLLKMNKCEPQCVRAGMKWACQRKGKPCFLPVSADRGFCGPAYIPHVINRAHKSEGKTELLTNYTARERGRARNQAASLPQGRLMAEALTGPALSEHWTPGVGARKPVPLRPLLRPLHPRPQATEEFQWRNACQYLTYHHMENSRRFGSLFRS